MDSRTAQLQRLLHQLKEMMIDPLSQTHLKPQKTLQQLISTLKKAEAIKGVLMKMRLQLLLIKQQFGFKFIIIMSKIEESEYFAKGILDMSLNPRTGGTFLYNRHKLSLKQ